jgi:hypothetical protein
MSAAGRGGPRIASDNYPTPAWATRRILEAIELYHYSVSGPRVLEPCAGEGAIVRVVKELIPNAHVVGGDVRDVFDLPGCVSYTWDATQPLGLAGPFDLLITNPPFAVAHEIIQAQRDTARLMVMLLRSSFIAGERAEAYRNDMPDEYRLPERPEFIASGRCKGEGGYYEDGSPRSQSCGWSEKIPLDQPRYTRCPTCLGSVAYSTTDSTPYSWFVWTPQRRSVGHSIILPSTPLEERKALAA